MARVGDEALRRLPDDLYIPPDALEVFLEAFEGPLDLLLYLIRRQNLDILDIPIAEITRQYMEYVELMREMRLELAAEYLVMAAMLAEIKSRMLLPRPAAAEEDEEEDHDPRAELIRRLQEYERFKKVAEQIDELPRVGRDIFPAAAEAPACQPQAQPPAVSLRELVLAFSEVMRRAQLNENHQVEREAISIRERMSDTLSRLNNERYTPFQALFQVEEGRTGVVVTFLALLELVRESMVELVQADAFAPIYIRAR
nr:ScpA family protein [Halorhodospira halophila]